MTKIMMPDYMKKMYSLMLSDGIESKWSRGVAPIMGVHNCWIPDEIRNSVKLADLDTLLLFYMKRLKESHPECFDHNKE